MRKLLKSCLLLIICSYYLASCCSINFAKYEDCPKVFNVVAFLENDIKVKKDEISNERLSDLESILKNTKNGDSTSDLDLVEISNKDLLRNIVLDSLRKVDSMRVEIFEPFSDIIFRLPLIVLHHPKPKPGPCDMGTCSELLEMAQYIYPIDSPLAEYTLMDNAGNIIAQSDGQPQNNRYGLSVTKLEVLNPSFVGEANLAYDNGQGVVLQGFMNITR